MQLLRNLATLASANPSAPALTCDGRTLSRADLLSAIASWRLRLRSLYARAQSHRVAMLAPNEADAVCALLAVVCSGATIVPLPAHLNDVALARLFRDSRSAGLLTIPSWAERGLAIARGKTVLPCIDTPSLQENGSRLTCAESDHPFNITYSSGTTGVPKGILQSRALRHSQVTHAATLGQGPESVSLLATPLDSDTTLAGLVGAIGNGSHLVLMKKFDAKAFLDTVAQFKVTHTLMVPIQYERILNHPHFDTDALSTLSVSVCTGAPLSVKLKKQLIEQWPGLFLEIYGLTEGGATTLLSIKDRPDKLDSVGQPLLDCEIRVIDDKDRAASTGETGEIVGCDNWMMTGYTDARATSAAIWTGPGGRRFIRTGDLGYLDSDGFLYLKGRRKDMLISGGYNVYPADIEAVIEQHAAVKEVAVVGAPDANWGEAPVAFVALRAGISTAAGDLLSWCRDRLGKTQRPREIFTLDSLPRNAAGKIDRRALRTQLEQQENANAD